MARMYLIIDGYNLMHAAGLGRKSYGPGDLETSRKRLVTLINSRLTRDAAADTLVVFDASQPSTHDSPAEASPPLTVRFSSDGRDADAEIEMLLETHSSPRQILVVSSDHRLHKAARRRRARCIDSEDFLSLQEPIVPSKKSGRKKLVSKRAEAAGIGPSQSTATADADYVQEFLNIDVNEIRRSVR